MRTAILLAFGVVVVATTTSLADDKKAGAPTKRAAELADYLTKDGKLKEALTFRKDTVGVSNPRYVRCDVWVIEPTGDCTSEAGARGKLSARQIAALAQHLATQDFHSLPATQGHQAAEGGGYERVVIGFGKKSAAFHVRLGEAPSDYLPKAGDPQTAAWSRFVALEHVLTRMLPSGPPPAARPPDGFEAPELILDGSTYGRLYPAFADLGGAGKLDMLVGTWNGRLLLFRNQGTKARPVYARPTWLDDTVPTANIAGVQG
jgi:hypothetical protein